MNTPRPEPRGERTVIATCALVFIASAWVTIAWCAGMCDMRMDMPGGWEMSMTWMRMGGQSRLDHFAMFMGMWVVMMTAMMMPAFLPTLLRYRRSVAGEATRPSLLAMHLALAYLAMWTAVGLLLYPLGMAVAGALLAKPALSQAAPWLGGALVALAGVMQFGPRKQRQLSCCQAAPRAFTRQPFTVSGAWRQGWRTGRDCVRCCAGLTVALLVLGVMDLLAMAAVTVAIAAERLTPAKARVAPALGVMLIAAGALLCFETQLTFP